MKYKVYLAGPDAFRTDAIAHGQLLINILKSYDIEGLYPLNNNAKLTEDIIENGRNITLANMEMIKSCDAVLANLIPFRSPSADVGTVWECGYAKGLGKVVWGYNVALNSHDNYIEYKDRVINKVSHDGMIVEDFGVWDNIMLVHGIAGVNSDFHSAAKALKLYLNRL